MISQRPAEATDRTVEAYGRENSFLVLAAQRRHVGLMYDMLHDAAASSPCQSARKVDPQQFEDQHIRQTGKTAA